MSDRPTPETDAETHDLSDYGSPVLCSWGDWIPVDLAKRLERERDELRSLLVNVINDGTDGKSIESVSIEFLRHVPSECESVKRERDEARKIGEKLSKQGLDMMDENRSLKRERDEARELVYAWESRWKAEVEFAAKVSVKRDELREVLKKCREDSICYAEHMRKCGYSEAYKESKENADRAKRILEETK
jgi:transposase-like protein